MGTAQEGLSLGKRFMENDEIGTPKSRNKAPAEFVFRAAQAVQLMAIHRFERLLRRDDISPKDVALILEALNKHIPTDYPSRRSGRSKPKKDDEDSATPEKDESKPKKIRVEDKTTNIDNALGI